MKCAGMAQSVERRIGSAEVTGSIPVSSLKTEVFSMIWISLGLFWFEAYRRMNVQGNEGKKRKRIRLGRAWDPRRKDAV